MKVLNSKWPYWEAIRKFPSPSYATGEHAFEGTSATSAPAAVHVQPESALPLDQNLSFSSSSSPTAVPTLSASSQTATSSISMQDAQKTSDDDGDMDMDNNSDGDNPQSSLAPSPLQPASLMPVRRSTPSTSSHGGGRTRSSGVRHEPYRLPSDQSRSITSRSNSDRSRTQGRMSETALMVMVSNDIRLAVSELRQSAAVAFATPPSAGTILQENKEGFPPSIILAAMSFFSEKENEGKAKMYESSSPQFRRDFVLQELRRAGYPVDQMLADAEAEAAEVL